MDTAETMSEDDEWEEIPTEELAEGTLVQGEMMVQEWAVKMRDPQYSLQQQGVYRDQHAQMQKCMEALRSQLLPVEVAARKRLREAEDKELEDDALKAGIAASLITAQDEELATVLALSTKAVPEEASDPAWRGSAEPELVSRQDFRPRASVVRGRDWHWQEQDGGAGNAGILGEHIQGSGWVEVTWQNGNVREYRVTGPYELQYATDEQQELAQELAQAIAMSM